MTYPAPQRALSALALLLASCSKPDAGARKEPPAPSAVPPAPSGAPSAASVSPKPKEEVPTLAPEAFEPASGMDFHPIEGAMMLTKDRSVFRIVGERVEPVATLSADLGGLNGFAIGSVVGAWPEDVEAVFTTGNGRASWSVVYPIGGPKGAAVTIGAGGVMGWLVDVARVGPTTVVGSRESLGFRIAPMRGPVKAFAFTLAEKAGCAEEDIRKYTSIVEHDAIAVPFEDIAGTEAGTLVTIGHLCGRSDSPAAEVWPPAGAPRVIKLAGLIKRSGDFRLVRGKGDDMWLVSDPVLRFHDGAFEPLPALESPASSGFVAAGKLHVVSGRTILRADEGRWTPIAKLPYRMKLGSLGMDDQGTIWVSHDGAARLRPTSDATAAECATPFVYLYDVSPSNDPKFTFPTTRKALSKFGEVADITLVEYWDGRRSLGVKVKSKGQGEALVAHVKATMKDEQPELTCYAPKKGVRVIDVTAK